MCGTVSASSRANHAARVAICRFRAPRGARLVTGSHYPGRGAPRADLHAGESNETRHGSLLRETSRARSWRDSFQG